MAEVSDLDERPYGVWWKSEEELIPASVSIVRRIGIAAHLRAGADEDDAAYLVDMFLDKAIKGDHARGHLDHCPILNEQVARGELNLRPEIRLLRESPATALVDDVPGGRFLLCREAMNLAIRKANKCGIGCVGLRTTPAFLNVHVRQAVDAGMIGIAMTQTYPLVAPLGGRTPLLGNAPIAVGIPASEHDPVILDMSVTEVSSSGVKLSAVQGKSISEGLILDESGKPTTSAEDFPAEGFLTHAGQRARGSLLPLGGGHKGYGLVFVVGLLAAVLSDTEFPWECEEIAQGIPTDLSQHYGSLYLAISPGEFSIGHDWRARVDDFIDEVKASAKREGATEILYPGEKSQRLSRQRLEADRFLLPRSQYDAVVKTADLVGMAGLLTLA